MDQREFTRRTQLVREQLGNDELFKEVNAEIQHDERVIAMGAKIQELRVAGKVIEENEYVSSNRDLIDGVRTEKLQERGIDIDIDKMQEESEERRSERVEKIHESLTGEETDSELLKLFLLTDDEGKLGETSIESPLFRERTRQAFNAYATSVRAFKALADYNKMYGVPTKNVGKADALRKEAHDAVSREVGKDLGLEFETARRLVAKIRDGVLPDTGEEATYSKSIARLGKGYAKRYGNDVADAVHEQLKPLRDMGMTPDEELDNHSQL
jgi:hypothetical protein